MRLFSTLCTLGLLALMTSCSTVTIPFALQSADVAPEELKKLEGTWLLDKETITIRQADDGTLRAAILQWKENTFELQVMPMTIARAGDAWFLSIRNDEDEDGRYSFIRYTITAQGDLVGWLPNIGVFEEAVKAGRLKGEIDKDKHSTHVRLSGTSEELLAFLADPANVGCFHLDNPIVCRRMAAAE